MDQSSMLLCGKLNIRNSRMIMLGLPLERLATPGAYRQVACVANAHDTKSLSVARLPSMPARLPWYPPLSWALTWRS